MTCFALIHLQITGRKKIIIQFVGNVLPAVSSHPTVSKPSAAGPCFFSQVTETKPFSTDRSLCSFHFLDSETVKVEGHFPHLYQLVFPPNLQPCTLAVIGLVQPFGALPPILEMQVRLGTAF